jgi:hypothetical protein
MRMLFEQMALNVRLDASSDNAQDWKGMTAYITSLTAEFIRCVALDIIKLCLCLRY